MTFCISYSVLLEISQGDVNIYNKISIYGAWNFKLWYLLYDDYCEVHIFRLANHDLM